MAKTNPPRIAVGGRLRRSREALGLTQAEICRSAGVTANAYNQWERGRRLVNLLDAMKLADALNITLDWLYRGRREEEPMRDENSPAQFPGWSEDTSNRFVDYGDYFVPEREAQIDIICGLIPEIPIQHVVELCCGEGLLSADLIEPESLLGRDVAARGWDDAVRRRSLELDGDLKAFEFFQDDAWNYFSDPEPDPIDRPSALLDQLKWLEAAGLADVDVHWLKAGHAIFSGVKPG